MSQIQRKFIQDNAVSGAKLRLDNNEMLRFRNAANTADVNVAKGTSADKFEFQLIPEMSTVLPVPSALKQVATVEYVQNYVLGKGDAKDAASALADSNLALTGTTPLVIDGVTVVDQMRIGLTGQTNATQNGIYVASVSGGNYTLARAPDAASSAQVTEGLYFMITQGTVYQGYEALLTTPDPITLGTTNLVFARYPSTLSQLAGDMLIKSGNTWSVDLASNGGLESTNPGNLAGQLRVKVDQATLEKDQTTRRDPSTGAVSGKRSKKSLFTLQATDVSNQYLDLPDVAADSSIQFTVVGGPTQAETVDYTVNYTGGVSSKTRVAFTGGLASAGVSALAAGDQVVVSYMAF
jgi:hypothetical protein